MIRFLPRSNQTTFVIQSEPRLAHFYHVYRIVETLNEISKNTSVYLQLAILLYSAVWTSIFQVALKIVQSLIPDDAGNNTQIGEVGTHQFDVYGSGSGI